MMQNTPDMSNQECKDCGIYQGMEGAPHRWFVCGKLLGFDFILWLCKDCVDERIVRRYGPVSNITMSEESVMELALGAA